MELLVVALRKVSLLSVSNTGAGRTKAMASGSQLRFVICISMHHIVGVA